MTEMPSQISDPAVRLCRVCIHHRPPGAKLDYDVCRAPPVATDLVTGTAQYGLACASARGRTGRCGVAGRWWRPASAATS